MPRVVKRKRPPSTPAVRITPEWQKRVSRRLEKLGKTQEWLADEAGVTAPAITRMLKPTQRTSRVAEKISQVLGIPLPEFRDEREQEVRDALRELRELDPIEFDAVVTDIQRQIREIKKSRDK